MDGIISMKLEVICSINFVGVRDFVVASILVEVLIQYGKLQYFFKGERFILFILF